MQSITDWQTDKWMDRQSDPYVVLRFAGITTMLFSKLERSRRKLLNTLVKWFKCLYFQIGKTPAEAPKYASKMI